MAKNSPAVRHQPAALAVQDLYTELNKPDVRGQIAKALGGADPDRVIAAAKAYLRTAEKRAVEGILECSPASFITACCDAATVALLPDGREGYLVPRQGRVRWVASWRGLIKLVRRASNVRSFAAEVVYEHEITKGGFLVQYGTERRLEHRPYMMLGLNEATRGKIVAAYATCRIDGDDEIHFYVADSDRLARARASSSNTRDDAPWVRHPGPMSRKTAIRDFVEWLPLPDPIRDLLGKCNDDADVDAAVLTVGAADPAHAAPTGDTRTGWNGGQTSATSIRARGPKRTVETTARESEPAPEREPGDDGPELFDDEIEAEGGRSEAP